MVKKKKPWKLGTNRNEPNHIPNWQSFHRTPEWEVSEHTAITNKTEKKAWALLCRLTVIGVSVATILKVRCMYCRAEEMRRYTEVVGSQSFHCEKRETKQREKM